MISWESKSEVMRRYNVTGYMYDMRYEEEQNIKIEAALANVDLEKSGFILDIGCGTGLLLGNTALVNETVVGVDFSRMVLTIARERTQACNNVHLILADADNLPFKKNMFNYLFLITIIQNVPTVTVTLAEAKRVANKGARIAVTGLKKSFSLEIFKQLLKRSGLHVSYLDESDTKFHLAICQKGPHQI